MFLGRVVEPGEPEWLPDDRDVVDMYLTEYRLQCGHYPWQEEEVDGLEPGYRVCGLCERMEPYKDSIREQNRKRDRDRHGLSFGWYPPREESDGD